MANQRTETSTRPPAVARWSGFDNAVRLEVMKRAPWSQAIVPEDDNDASSVDIDAAFQRKLAGLRHLPRGARSSALRAARDERDLALRGLRERRAARRGLRRLVQQQYTPGPSG